MKIVFLSDIHYGTKRNNAVIHQSIMEFVLPFINNNPVDLIIIGGDDVDDRLSLDTIAARCWLEFVSTITSIHKDGKCLPVRFIAGTESHQCGQLRALGFVLNDINRNVKAYDNVGIESFNGYNLLYIPEESVTSKENYYAEYLSKNNKIDIVAAHGTPSFATIGHGWGEEIEKCIRGTPIWELNDFKNILGPVLFGHIHNHTIEKNKIFCAGGLTQLCFGEDAPKGFLYVDIDDNNHSNYTVQHIQNPFSLKYHSLIYSVADLEKTDAENIIKNTEKYLNKHKNIVLRVILWDNDNHNNRTKISIIKNYFVHNRQLNVKVVVKSAKDVRNDENVSKQNAYASKFSDIRNPEDWIENTISYAKTQYDADITADQIREIVGKSIAYNRGDANVTI